MTRGHALKGIIVALVTPFDKHGTLTPALAEPLIRQLLKVGVHGFYVGGGTGEAFIQSTEERIDYLRYVSDLVGKNAALIAHVGAMASRDAWRLAGAAEEAGYDAISSTPPFYFGYTEREVLEYFKDLAMRSSLPLIVYNAPHSTGRNLNLEMQRSLLDLPRVQGMKHTDPNFFTAERLISEKSNVLVFNGPDEMLLSGLAIGMVGGIGTTYNILPRYALEVFDCMQEGNIDQARSAQSAMNRVIDELLRISPSVIPGVKHGLRVLGFDVGEARKPFASLHGDTKKYEELLLQSAGLSTGSR